MAGADNLKGHGFDKRSADEVREIQSRGGRKSGEARRRKADAKKAFSLLLSLPPDKVNEITLKEMGFKDTEINNLAVLAASMFQEAIGGNVRAAELVLNTVGEGPAQAAAPTIQIINDIPRQAE